ncbi:MAG: hypothetical protein LBO66_03080 [Deltaproteobacteria bacterium]|nr:hypothetical protein [Deltaproteobacteria bacterium]
MSQDIANSIISGLTSLNNEAVAHITLFSYLQRALNGRADSIMRECALGRRRVDIIVIYKGRRYPLELKIKGERILKKSLERLYGYMDTCGASEGWLVVFDKDFGAPIKGGLTWETLDYKGRTINVVGC